MTTVDSNQAAPTWGNNTGASWGGDRAAGRGGKTTDTPAWDNNNGDSWGGGRRAEATDAPRWANNTGGGWGGGQNAEEFGDRVGGRGGAFGGRGGRTTEGFTARPSSANNTGGGRRGGASLASGRGRGTTTDPTDVPAWGNNTGGGRGGRGGGRGGATTDQNAGAPAWVNNNSAGGWGGGRGATDQSDDNPSWDNKAGGGRGAGRSFGGRGGNRAFGANDAIGRGGSRPGGRGASTGGNRVPLGTNNDWNSGWGGENKDAGTDDRAPPRTNRRPPREGGEGTKTSESYIPEVRPIDELFSEDVASSDFYKIVPEDDEDISITGLNVAHFKHIDVWENIGLDEKILENIRKSQYTRPRKIQSWCIPIILEGRDIKGHAETGSGKTAAFMLPIIQMIMKKKETPPETVLGKPAPYAIIIEPTRELCAQVAEQGRKFATGTGVNVTKSYGQYDSAASRREIIGGCDILCATPGRLKHILYSDWLRYNNITFFILDEADRLLEEGFIDVVRDIITLPEFPEKSNRQNMLFSATFPPLIQRLSVDVLKPDNVMVSNRKLVAANSRVLQTFIAVLQENKKAELLKLLKKDIETATASNPEKPNIRRTLVFVQRRRDADLLSIWLSGEGIKATTINGDRSQSQRERALREFRLKEVHVLVSTDVCARGIDIKDLDHVVNYDLPDDPVVYVHRIGRTGRISNGFATSFFDDYNESDRCLAAHLVKFVTEAGQEAPEFLRSVAEDTDFHALPLPLDNKAAFDPNADPWADLEPPAPHPSTAPPVVVAWD